MKTSIPSDVWEKKKALIARLYKDEEWPLKQVIKQIRTEDFNPSETQLRSRLKKWRVTKPSRQTRKKAAGEQGDNEDEDEEDGSEEMSPMEVRSNNNNKKKNDKRTTPASASASASTTVMALPTPSPLQPQSQQSQHSQPELAITREWYPTDVWAQSQHEQQVQSQQTVINTQPETITAQSWTSSVSAPSPINVTPEQHQSSHGSISHINTPVVTQFPAHGLPAYDLSQQQQQHSPDVKIQSQSSHVLQPAFVSPTYSMAPISFPQPAPSTATSWPSGNDFIEPDASPAAAMTMQPTSWYTGMYDAASAAANTGVAASTAYYQRAMNSAAVAGYTPVMQNMASPQNISASYQVSTPAQTQAQPMTNAGYPGYDENLSVRPWRRATGSHYTPESTPGIARVDRQGRQRKSVSQRKVKDSAIEEMEILAAQQQQQQQQHLQSMQQQVQSVHAAIPSTYQQQHQLPHYIATGHHPQALVPHDMYAYAGHEQLLQRPLGH